MTACTICPDRLLRPLLPLAFWLVVWQLAALAVGQSFILPGPAAVLGTLIQLAGVPSFWQTALLSLVRVLAGLLAGTLLGALIAALTCASRWADVLLSPAVRVIRAVPVVSFILFVLMMTLVVPLTLGLVAVYAACRRVDVYDALIQGAGEGLGTLARIIPSLVGLMTAVYMLRASGALDLAAHALAPLLDRVGVPAELLPLMLVRPISGSAALGVGAELITSSGPDSYVGRVAAVMLGSTETTFYTIAVYFGAVGISRTRYAVPAALCADLTGFLAAAWAVRLCFGGG